MRTTIAATVLSLSLLVSNPLKACTITVCNNGPCPSKAAVLELTCPETAWRVTIRNTLKGLQVGRADLRRTPTSPWLQVLYSGGLAEIYVPYHPGTPRLSDTQFCNLPPGCLRPVDANDLGTNGQLITMGGDSFPTAVAEIRDRGIVWLCKWDSVKKGTGSKSRRGQEMVVWGTWDPGNYDYVIEYRFRDDGQISFRVGATGWNNSDVGEDVAHMHTNLWRVDMDLNGPQNDRPMRTIHAEPVNNPLEAADYEVPFDFLNAENFMDLDPLSFATLVIDDVATTNAAGNHISYELEPYRVGTARHYAGNEQWTQHDTWVTRYSGLEEQAALSIPHYFGPDDYLAGAQNSWGIGNSQPVVGQDIVVWHVSSAHHDPHDEDQAMQDPTHGHRGLTLMHWSGFDLVPRNLFDYNPLGSPYRADCDGPL